MSQYTNTGKKVSESFRNVGMKLYVILSIIITTYPQIYDYFQKNNEVIELLMLDNNIQTFANAKKQE